MNAKRIIMMTLTLSLLLSAVVPAALANNFASPEYFPPWLTPKPFGRPQPPPQQTFVEQHRILADRDANTFFSNHIQGPHAGNIRDRLTFRIQNLTNFGANYSRNVSFTLACTGGVGGGNLKWGRVGQVNLRCGDTLQNVFFGFDSNTAYFDVEIPANTLVPSSVNYTLIAVTS